jgi:hypothetical protein
MKRYSLAIDAGAACVAALVYVSVSWIALSAHPVRGITEPSATAFVGSPTAGSDLPVPVAWGTPPNRFDSGVSVACFHVANTTQLPGSEWPRVTAVGFELPGARSGFTLLTPQDQGWQVVENISVDTPRGVLTVDFALVAPVNPMGHSTAGNPQTLLGLPPNQPSGRGNGTPFCVAGPFPPGFSIEQIIDGVVVRFHRVQPNGPSIDLGLWDSATRTVPLYP